MSSNGIQNHGGNVGGSGIGSIYKYIVRVATSYFLAMG